MSYGWLVLWFGRVVGTHGGFVVWLVGMLVFVMWLVGMSFFGVYGRHGGFVKLLVDMVFCRVPVVDMHGGFVK